MKRTKSTSLASQMRKRSKEKPKKASKRQYDGDIGQVVSTGSTLLDLNISGGRVRGGGIPSKILVEIFGPNGSGKTVLLSEIAGAIQRAGGDDLFHDPEARLNAQFAQIFEFDSERATITNPDTVNQVFKSVLDWEPNPEKEDAINGIFTDSLAALSTEMEMEDEDKMGMKRAKDFSSGFRKICRYLVQNNYLMVCSNQIRDNADARGFTQKWVTPGGKAVGFYASLRLKTAVIKKITDKKKINGKEVRKVKGIEVEVEVFKSSVWEPHGKAIVPIIFDYGIDDIRANLQYIKDYEGGSVYSINGRNLNKSLEKSIAIVEEEELEDELREQVIDLWEKIDSKFRIERKKKKR